MPETPAPPAQRRPAGAGPRGAFRGLGAAAALACASLALLQAPPPAPDARPPEAGGTCALGPAGYLRGQFFGAVELTADWAGRGLTCDGMHRPGGQGVRLYFAGSGPAGGRLAVLVSLAGLPAAIPTGEHPANVTVIDEASGRFFSSAGPGRCWASVSAVQPVAAGAGRPAGSRVDGLVYCLGALPSVGDRASLTLGDLRFAGWVVNDAG
jgi:hypothetical protein